MILSRIFTWGVLLSRLKALMRRLESNRHVLQMVDAALVGREAEKVRTCLCGRGGGTRPSVSSSAEEACR